jgi:hypothetical protein
MPVLAESGSVGRDSGINSVLIMGMLSRTARLPDHREQQGKGVIGVRILCVRFQRFNNFARIVAVMQTASSVCWREKW